MPDEQPTTKSSHSSSKGAGKSAGKSANNRSGTYDAIRPRKASVEQRRDLARRIRGDELSRWRGYLGKESTWVSIGIAVVFAVLVGLMLHLRPEVVPYRLGQTLRQDVVARAPFSFYDPAKFQQEVLVEQQATQRVYARSDVDPFTDLEQWLKALPRQLVNKRLEDLDPPLRQALDNATLARLQEFGLVQPSTVWNNDVETFIRRLRDMNPVVLPAERLAEEQDRFIRADGHDRLASSDLYGIDSPALQELLNRAGEQAMSPELYPKVAALARHRMQPTHRLDADATTRARDAVASSVSRSRGELKFADRDIVVPKGKLIDLRDLNLLRAEASAYQASLGAEGAVARFVGIAGIGVLLTTLLAIYTAVYQPRIVHNHTRAIGLAALFLGTLLVAQLAATSTSPLYLFGTAPTLLAAMILAIAYDRRYALGASILHAAFVTLVLSAGVNMLLVLSAGVVVVVLMLDEIRNRSKLIEVGGAAAITMMVATFVVGMTELDTWPFLLKNSLYAGASGLGVGFVVLGILPFVEKTFRITTSMTLLELADVNNELLRRMQTNAPGSYNHSMQVAILAEEAARSIGANALLCRVAGYYHDIGKIHKSEYFIENQSGGESKHLHLSPSVSLLIIIGHVKDGVELAREYNLPRVVIPFIQEHHGTTLVEYFYRTAIEKGEQSDEHVPEDQYRYPGPKPHSKETAIMMLADTCESAVRAMKEYTPGRIEQRVNDLAMKRLLDGQFDNCGLTMKDLDAIKRSLVKSLISIYHGRIEYPSDKPQPAAPASPKLASA